MIQIRRSRGAEPSRVLLTRDVNGNRSWARALRRAGLQPVELPCLELAVTSDAELVERFVTSVASAMDGDWLVFTSSNGVEAATRLLEDADATPPDGLRLAAVGPATAARCRQVFGRCDLQPPGDQASAVGLGRLMTGRTPTRALLAMARGGRREVVEALRGAGWQVERFDLYETRPVQEDGSGSLDVDAVFLASPSAVAGLLARADLAPDVPLLAIGPTTASALEDVGRKPAGVAETPALESLVDLFHALPTAPDRPAEIPI